METRRKTYEKDIKEKDNKTPIAAAPTVLAYTINRQKANMWKGSPLSLAACVTMLMSNQSTLSCCHAKPHSQNSCSS
jgi:hypothetical protein